MSSIDAILSQYEKNTQPAAGGNRISSEERLKRYFTTILPKGTQSGQKRIRILPTTDGTSPFQEIAFHEVQVDGKWLKLYDPSQDGDVSPLNEVRQSLLATGSEDDKILARNYRAKKFYIVKVIDRENEQDGPKFWRFKHKKTGDGVMDKLIPLFQQKGDITDAREGRDIIISTGRNDKGYSVVQSIMPDDPSILTNDKQKADEWYGNEETHRDVYSKKTEEYLNIVAVNKTPIWDSEQSKYVAEEDREEKETASLEDEINLMSNGTGNNFGITTNNSVSADLDNDLTDELPF